VGGEFSSALRARALGFLVHEVVDTKLAHETKGGNCSQLSLL